MGLSTAQLLTNVLHQHPNNKGEQAWGEGYVATLYFLLNFFLFCKLQIARKKLFIFKSLKKNKQS